LAGKADGVFRIPVSHVLGVFGISAERTASAGEGLFSGVVPSEDSSGKRTRRGGITKTGNAHLRRIVVEAAWSYRRPPGIWYGLRRRQESISEEAKEIAWKAQHRLHKRYIKLGAAGKDQRKIVTAVARERWALSGLLEAEPRLSPGSKLQPDNSQNRNFLKRRTPNR